MTIAVESQSRATPRSRLSRWAIAVTCVFATILVASLITWFATRESGWSTTFSFRDLRGSLSLGSGKLQFDLFRDEAEDEFYHHYAVSWRAIAMGVTLFAASASWWMHRRMQRRRAHGFDVAMKHSIH